MKFCMNFSFCNICILIDSVKMKATVLCSCSLILSLVQITMSDSSESSSISDSEEELDIMGLLNREREEESSEIRRRKRGIKATQYMNYLLELFQDELDSSSTGESRMSEDSPITTSPRIIKINNQNFAKPTEKLFHAWLPSQVNQAHHSTSETTVVTFQQTMLRHEYGSFTSSRIVITLRDDVDETELPPNTVVKINIPQNQSFSQTEVSQLILRDKKFYSFHITEFIRSKLQHNPTTPNLVNISFYITATQGRGQILDFRRFFDVQVDLPTIVYFYNGFEPEKTDFNKKRNRKRRAIFGTSRKDMYSLSRPISHCQRRELLVGPEQVDLHYIVGPKLLDLGYCSGSCQYPMLDSYFNYTMHTFIMDKFRLGSIKSVPSDMPRSKCVPISYKSISVLVQVPPDNVKAEIMENFSVGSCGCR